MALFERKNGLSELAMAVDPANEAMYEKIVGDMGRTTMLFKRWWDEKSAAYAWKSAPDGHWEINFDTCEIFLVTNG